MKLKEQEETPLYNYSPSSRRLIPILGESPTEEEIRRRAEAEAERIAEIIEHRPASGGRAG